MAKAGPFLIRFWGVRGSYPTPGTHTVRHGGNTACLEIQAGGHTLIFDAGSGIIRLGEALLQRAQGEPLPLSLFLTHGHGDHLVGFPFFAPLFSPKTCLHLFGPQLAGQSVEQLVTPLMSPPYFPVDIRRLPSQRCFHTIASEQCICWSPGESEPELERSRRTSKTGETLRVTAQFTSSHPLNGALVYRVEYAQRCVVYATDVEWGSGCEAEFLAFVEGADVLIHDAQYTESDYQQKRGFGHSTVAMAVEAAHAARVKQLVLFHHEPTYSDEQLDRMEAEARAGFARSSSAYEGMEIELL
jgi:phosphoribosyl 1,2-cyclic phosphodiesterase